MFLTVANLAKSKSKTLLVQMVSAAGTGYCFNTKRGRLREKLILRKHDPLGLRPEYVRGMEYIIPPRFVSSDSRGGAERLNKHVLFFEKKKIRSL